MKKPALIAVCAMAALAMNAGLASAHGIFRTHLKDTYSLKSVSCYTCHARKTDLPESKHEAYAENSKQFLNAFGTELGAGLKGKDVSKRMEEVKPLDKEDAKRVATEAAVLKEFIAALQAVEAKKTADGITYKQAISEAKLDGLKK